MYPSIQNSANRVFDAITLWLLPVGYFLLLSALFFLPDRSLHHKLYYALFSIPTLIALCLRPAILKELMREPIVQLFTLFVLFALLSILWSASDSGTSGLIKRPLHIFMLFAGTCLLVQHRPEMVKPIFFGAALLAVAGSLDDIHAFALTYTQGERLVGSGAMDNPLLSSHLFGFFCTFWLWAALYGKTLRTLGLCLVGLVIMFTAVLATGSRTPLVALAMVVAWMTLLRAGWRSLLLLLVIPVVGIILLIVAPEMITGRGDSYRFEIWRYTLDQILRHPWIGSGYDAPLSIDLGIGYVLSEPHNFALGVLYNLGIIGFLPWAGMIVVGLYSGWRNRGQQLFVLASTLLVFGIGAGLTEGGGIMSRPKEHWFLLWIPLALIAALSIAQRAGRLPRVEMRRLSRKDNERLLGGATIIEEDGLGPKVLRLQDGSFLKLFRRRRWFTSGGLNPYSQRFVSNSQRLGALGFVTPRPLDLHITADGSQGVRYQPLPGHTVRQAFDSASSADERKRLGYRLGQFVAQLHGQGVYFRSLHLGNVLLLDDDRFGLIDLADMRILPSPLSHELRQRNLRHMQRYPEDRAWLFEENVEALLEGYAEGASSRDVHLIRKQLHLTDQ
ncbi:polymerase [Pseudomonas putida CSV86]|uniref:Polymerase n=1 Tax=Pseudomonas bharatica CSV86 TaxID=1005395 RepID=L1M0E4_9PSED|nr:polymerase [Pseudomonas bharatica CSV86]